MLTLALDFELQAGCSLLRLHKRCQSLPGLPLFRRSWYMYYLLLSHGKNGLASEPQYCVCVYIVCIFGFPRWCTCSLSLFKMSHIRFTIHFLRKSVSMLWYMIYLLTAIGLRPAGSSTVHINTQTVHRTTQLTFSNW